MLGEKNENVVELSRIIEGLKAKGWNSTEILDFIQYIISGDSKIKFTEIEQTMVTNNQIHAVIKMIITLVKQDTPKDELIEYLQGLLN